MISADSFIIPSDLRTVARTVREHYNESGMVIARELLFLELRSLDGKKYKFDLTPMEEQP